MEIFIRKTGKKQKKHKLLVFPLAIILAALTITLSIQNLKLLKTIGETPSQIVITDITSTSTNIYWKSNEGVNSTLFFKQKNHPLYSPAYNSNLYKNIQSDDYVYQAILEDLQPNTTYSFYIQTPRRGWDWNLEFETKGIDERIELPEIKYGNSEVGSFILLQSGEGNNMIYTRNSDSWAIDLRNDDYTVNQYAQYIPSMILQEKLEASLFKIVSPVNAQSGANCKTNIVRNDNQYYPNKKGVSDLLDRLIGGCKGHYTDECYNDVYCTSIEKGVNPGLPLTLWVHESAGSMYAKYTDVEDFGIHGGGVPSRNFTNQLNHLLDVQMADNYISGYCTDKGLSEEQRWATKYAKGYCTDENIVAGKAYISEIRTYYSWLKGSNFPSWPWNVSANSNACDRSKEVTNVVYRDCSGNPTGTNPPSEPSVDCSGPDTIPGKYDILVGETCTDVGGCECFKGSIKSENYLKDVACGIVCTKEVEEERTKIDVTTKDEYCTNSKGCICYWDSRNVQKEAKNNQTCTVGKEVIDTTKVCCQQGEDMNTVYPYNCEGSIWENIPLNSCKIRSFKYNLTKGINFVKANNTLNTDTELINSAQGLIEYSGNRITTIAFFNNGTWEKIVEFKDEQIYGADFILDPTQTYLMIATEDFSLESTGYTVNPLTLDLQNLTGWNLISTSIFGSRAQKAYTMFEMTEFDPIKQIAFWNKDVSMFEYTVESRDKTIIGEDITLTAQDSIFINIPK